MCMFSLGDFLYLFYFLLGARGLCGLLLNGILFIFFFWGGGGHVWSTLRLRLRLGIVSGGRGILKFKCFWGMFDTYILRKGCGAK